MATALISIAKFLADTESGLIEPLFAITYNSEKRVYGRSPEGDATTGKQWHIVFAVVS